MKTKKKAATMQSPTTPVNNNRSNNATHKLRQVIMEFENESINIASCKN